MIASPSGLHPLGTALADDELRFAVRNAGRVGEAIVVECTYRPFRERDVRKERNVHLVDWPGRNGSRDRFSVKREDFHLVVQEVRVEGNAVNFALPLRDPADGYRGYQLASVRVGELVFDRWFTEVPSLDAGFGLECGVDTLRGTVRAGMIAARPLAGVLPLWPTLRAVELEISPVKVPVVRLWDSQARHHWDGWRQAIPQEWPGGRSIVVRHINGPTVWRENDYFAIPPSEAPDVQRPRAPSGAWPGITLEIFWPEGNALEFPEILFGRPPAVLGIRAGRLTPRVRELLALSAELRPGVEQNSLTAAEWAEFEALVEETATAPAEFALQKTSEGKDVLVVQRRELNEPWVYLFGVEYDSDRRFAINALLLSPARWTGSLPE